MLDRQWISMALPVRHDYWFECVGTYFYDWQTKPRWTWPLQRLACWFMERWGGHYRHLVTTVNTVEIDGRDLMQLLNETRHAIEAVYNIQPCYVFLGLREYHELLRRYPAAARELTYCGPLQVDLSKMSLHLTGPGGVQRIMGMKLVLIPWMEGVLVTPDLPRM